MSTTNNAATGKTYSKKHSTFGADGDRVILRVRGSLSGQVTVVDLTGVSPPATQGTTSTGITGDQGTRLARLGVSVDRQRRASGAAAA